MSDTTTHRVEHTSPIWRIVAIACMAGAFVFLGFYLQAVGHASDFATIAVIAAGYTFSFWAHKRPDRVQVRFGPFGRIAEATIASVDEIREYVYARPLKVGFVIAIGYGLAVVLAKSLVVYFFGILYSWEIAVAAALAVAAIGAVGLSWTKGLSDKLTPGGSAKPEDAAVSEPVDDGQGEAQ